MNQQLEIMDAKPQPTITFHGDNAVIFKALIIAQKNMGDVIKKSTNPAFKSKYADLSGVTEPTVPAYNGAGFYVMQHSSYLQEQRLVQVDTMLLHESGGRVEAQHFIPVSKTDAQGIGSATTYGRRYALIALAGLAPEDDDGNAACEKPKQQESNISDAQYNNIIDMVNATNTDMAAMCKFYKVAKISELKASQYDSVIAKLKTKAQANDAKPSQEVA